MEVKIYREPENEALILDEIQLAEYNDLALELGFATQENAEEQNVPNMKTIKHFIVLSKFIHFKYL
jgi:hypothetical protein